MSEAAVQQIPEPQRRSRGLVPLAVLDVRADDVAARVNLTLESGEDDLGPFQSVMFRTSSGREAALLERTARRPRGVELLLDVDEPDIELAVDDVLRALNLPRESVRVEPEPEPHATTAGRLRRIAAAVVVAVAGRPLAAAAAALVAVGVSTQVEGSLTYVLVSVSVLTVVLVAWTEVAFSRRSKTADAARSALRSGGSLKDRGGR